MRIEELAWKFLNKLKNKIFFVAIKVDIYKYKHNERRHISKTFKLLLNKIPLHRSIPYTKHTLKKSLAGKVL